VAPSPSSIKVDKTDKADKENIEAVKPKRAYNKKSTID
jgi:hypothetical protein